MTAPAGLLALIWVLQVPPPNAAAKLSDDLRRQERAVLDAEASKLSALAATLPAGAAAEVRAHLPPSPPPDGALRFDPLPEVVPARGRGLANVPASAKGAGRGRAELDAILAESARALFALANRAASSEPKHYALADACLRAVVRRQPDHPEARRLLGYVPYEGGWATPYAVSQFRDGKTFHPTYGWVKSDWVPHLENGELPARPSRASARDVWLPAAQADAQRRDWATRWAIETEHFRIGTNVPLAEAISFGRHLETLHEVFQSLFADVIGESLPLARRFKSRTAVGEAPAEKHSVSYFATREEYVDHVRPLQGPDIEQSLGLYLPAKGGRGRRGHAYFFRDPGGELAVTATLDHEVSHQLLFESGVAGPNDYKRNVGNYWVFEGLGTYFETLSVEPDGSVRVGGKVGPRFAEARKTLGAGGQMVPIAAFVRYDQNAFNGGDIFKHYQQAVALTVFLMNGKGGAYREDFLHYVRDACRGRLQRTTGRSLEDRLGTPYDVIEAELRAYLR